MVYRTIGWLGVAAAVGCSAAMALFYHFLQPLATFRRQKYTLLVVLAALFVWFVWVQLNRVLRPRLAEFSVPKRLLWMAAAAAVGVLLIWVIPVAPAPVRSAHSVKIVATGKKSAASQGSEVWVYGLFTPDGQCVVPPSEFSKEGDWEVREGALCSYGRPPATLTWEGLGARDLQLQVLSHPWSGIAKVAWNGGEQEVDLYSTSGARKTITPSVAPPERTRAKELLLRAAEVIVFAAGFLWLALYLVTRPNTACARAVGRWTWLAYALPPLAYWSYYLWVFWPGLMSSDSYGQWDQMVSGNYNDWHPAFHTMSNWLITRLWLSPAAIAIAQIVALSVMVGLGLAWMRRNGMARWLAVATCLLVAWAPANALSVITLWKDIPYGIAILGLVLILMAIVRSEGEWLTKRSAWILLVILASAVALYRHNGPPIAMAVLLILPLVYRQYWRRLVLSLIVFLGVFAAVKGPLYRTVKVEPMPAFFKAVPLLHHIAAHIAAKTPLTSEEWEVLNRILPLDKDNTWPYDPYTVNCLLYDKRLKPQAVADQMPQVFETFFSLLRRRPEVDLLHMKITSELVWQVKWSRGYVAIPWCDDKDVVFVPDRQGQNIPVERPIPPGLRLSLRPACLWLTWRPALFMYLFFAGIVVAAIRSQRWSYLLVALPVVVQASVMAIIGIAPDYRYHWGVYLSGMVCSGFLLSAIPRAEQKLVLIEGSTREGHPGDLGAKSRNVAPTA